MGSFLDLMKHDVSAVIFQINHKSLLRLVSMRRPPEPAQVWKENKYHRVSGSCKSEGSTIGFNKPTGVLTAQEDLSLNETFLTCTQV